MSEKPTDLIKLVPFGRLKRRLRGNGVRWQGAFRSIDEAVKKAWERSLEPLFLIEYRDEDA